MDKSAPTWVHAEDSVRGEIEKHAAVLGVTSEEVARNLRAVGIRGRRGRACDCPIARWFQHAMGGVAVTVSEVCIIVKVRYRGNMIIERIDTTPAIAQFVAEFDHGRWSDLRDDS